ncbi:hypothetical protein COOONC_14631 [Cooperia oncophora]
MSVAIGSRSILWWQGTAAKTSSYYTADLREDREVPVRGEGKTKVANGLKKSKNSKVKNGGVKKVKKQRGEAVKGTCIEHKMLGGSDDEMYDSDLVDVSDMTEDVKEEEEDDDITVPMANASDTRQLAVAVNDIKHEDYDLAGIPKKRSKKARSSESRVSARRWL